MEPVLSPSTSQIPRKEREQSASLILHFSRFPTWTPAFVVLRPKGGSRMPEEVLWVTSHIKLAGPEAYVGQWRQGMGDREAPQRSSISEIYLQTSLLDTSISGISGIIWIYFHNITFIPYPDKTSPWMIVIKMFTKCSTVFFIFYTLPFSFQPPCEGWKSYFPTSEKRKLT